MKIISHRGNLNGLTPEDENKQFFIDNAISEGFDVEVDLWKISKDLWLGHDNPQYRADLSWLLVRRESLWIHTKNFDALNHLSSIGEDVFQFFWHTNDRFVLTSTGCIWAHEFENIKDPENCIVPFLDLETLEAQPVKDWFGICTDYPVKCKEIYSGESNG